MTRTASKPRSTPRQLEGIVKGFANHRRIGILFFLHRHPESSLEEICRGLRIQFKTGSEHVRRLAIAGLVLKRHDGPWVRHKLTDRAKRILTFLRMLE